MRVYGDFLGCAVPPGEHEVRLRFAPKSLRRGAGVTGAGFVLLACLGWLQLRWHPGRDAPPRDGGES